MIDPQDSFDDRTWRPVLNGCGRLEAEVLALLLHTARLAASRATPEFTLDEFTHVAADKLLRTPGEISTALFGLQKARVLPSYVVNHQSWEQPVPVESLQDAVMDLLALDRLTEGFLRIGGLDPNEARKEAILLRPLIARNLGIDLTD